jgi:hypothetical protein
MGVKSEDDMKRSKGDPLKDLRAAIKSLDSLAEKQFEADSSEQPTLEERVALLSEEEVAA